jgi:hypothetical protein
MSIDGPRIVSTLESTYRRYAALDDGLPFVLALWTLATHVFDCFDAFPYLAVTSPTKRCGKTRVGEIINLLSCGGLQAASASVAAIFRTIQMCTAKRKTVTLIMDEMEVLGTRGERSEDLREILNAGYRRGQSVLRCDGEKFEPRKFSVYCPKVLILIGTLNDTLADRCIPIAMRRRKSGEKVARFFYFQAKRSVRVFLGEVERWAKTNRSKVKWRLRRDLEFLQDREAELWLPLFATCQVASPERVEELKTTALRISARKQSEEPADMGILLLKDIRDTFQQSREDRLSSSKLLMELNNIEVSPWVSWSKGKGLDARGLARLLRPFKIEPHNLRLHDGLVVKGYERADFEESWSTYLSPLPAATPLQAAQTQPTNGPEHPLRNGPVADTKPQESQQTRGV